MADKPYQGGGGGTGGGGWRGLRGAQGPPLGKLLAGGMQPQAAKDLPLVWFGGGGGGGGVPNQPRRKRVNHG